MPPQRPLPRPKRAGEEFARTHFQSTDDDSAANGHSTKKPRFDVRNPSALAPDAVEDDIVLEADEIGKRGQQAKRNAVNIDGYESDSSNEGFDARADLKAKEKKNGNKGAAKKSKDEEDHDMFADLEEGAGGDGDDDEELTREGKKRAKNVRFLGVEEIEGQVASSTSGGHVSSNFSLATGGNKFSSSVPTKSNSHYKDSASENESESDVGEADRAAVGSDSDASELGAGSKKQHAPLLDAFNMRSEQEEGRFDEQGNFVRKAADPDAVHDTWLEGVSKKDMRRAREAAEKRDEEERQRRRDEDAMLTSDLLKRLIPLLERGETPLEALARLGKSKTRQKQKPKWHKSRSASDPAPQEQQQQQQQQQRNNTLPPPAEIDPAEQARLDAIETITATTSLLLSRDHAEIYSTERELLTREYQRETGDAWVDRRPSSSPSPPPSPSAAATNTPIASSTSTATNGAAAAGGKDATTTQWEYRWADQRDGGVVHGPYDGATMSSWRHAGYFGDGVEFRVVSAGGQSSPESETWRTAERVQFV